MKFRTSYLVLGSLWLLAFNTPSPGCVDAGSMIGFVETHLKNALDAEEIALARYHTYKAINTMEKSRPQFEDCACDYAKKHLKESLENLKLATRVSSLEGTRILLRRALDGALAGEEALDLHDELHDSPYDSDVLAMNSMQKGPSAPLLADPDNQRRIEEQIDASLQAYKASLADVVNGVPCSEALVFVQRIYDHCERQLLREDLTQAKRYYNYRTKELTEEALRQLQGCP
ncbi:hypothetical protein [Robiginitalea sp. SC105]|uniref:hypothetical protein n=1 Tax=Robiginitalea sp. SC105 TaxID=2762332 RepID=UPI00163B5177|nr:hypothetical protein [Robiginitalea sp. SC105]MBC2839906.1 hypothetical protein [Robiginitalea sp. SC105]